MDRQNPFTEIERMFDQLSSQFGEFESQGTIAVDLADTGDSFTVTADMPSFESEDIEVILPDPRTVRIDATRSTETETEEGDEEMRYIRQERREQSVSRSVPLPEEVDESAASAAFENGVLTITLPKIASSDSTTIPLS